MAQYRKTNYLQHHGVKGMKWGVRRTPKQLGHDIRKRRAQKKADKKAADKAYRQKMEKIADNYNASVSDRRRANYAKNQKAVKVGTMAVKSIMEQAMFDSAMGRSYNSMSPQQKARSVAEAAVRTAVNYKVSESLAKSTAAKYNENGRKLRSVKGNKILEKEDLYETGYKIAIGALPLANYMAGAKLGKAMADRKANEAKFKSWGGNILEMKFDDIVGMSDNEWRFKK